MKNLTSEHVVDQNHASVDWVNLNGKRFLKFVFLGNFTEKLANDLIQRWKNLMHECNDNKIFIICECTNMKDYDAKARIIYQKTLMEFKDRIQGFWVITPSKIIKYGAIIMATFTGFPIKVVEKEEDIKI